MSLITSLITVRDTEAGDLGRFKCHNYTKYTFASWYQKHVGSTKLNLSLEQVLFSYKCRNYQPQLPASYCCPSSPKLNSARQMWQRLLPRNSVATNCQAATSLMVGQYQANSHKCVTAATVEHRWCQTSYQTKLKLHPSIEIRIYQLFRLFWWLQVIQDSPSLAHKLRLSAVMFTRWHYCSQQI